MFLKQGVFQKDDGRMEHDQQNNGDFIIVMNTKKQRALMIELMVGPRGFSEIEA